MKAKTPIENVNLSFVCDRDWGKMKPCSSGRHCQDCNKPVVDFTNKTMVDLQAALSKDGQVCGRFKAAQVNTGPGKGLFSLRRIAASFLLALGFSAFSKGVNAQSTSHESTNHQHEEGDTQMFFGLVMETMPVYRHGGEKGMLTFIQKNLNYPETERPSGLVVSSFVVDTAGNVTEPKIVKSLSQETDEEVLRLVKLLKFHPAIQNGKAVRARYTLPVRFSEGVKDKK